LIVLLNLLANLSVLLANISRDIISRRVLVYFGCGVSLKINFSNDYAVLALNN